MEFTITNQALEHIYTKYNTRRISTLSTQDIYQLCAELRINPAYNTPEIPVIVGAPTPTPTLNKLQTEKLIQKHFTFSYAMPISEIIKDDTLAPRLTEDGRNISADLRNAATGDETFEVFEQLGVGFRNLKPGDTVTVDFTTSFVEEYFSKTPMYTELKVVDETGKVWTEKVKDQVKETKAKKTEDYSNYTHKELMTLAKELNETKEAKIKVFGVSQSDLLKSILQFENK